MNEEIEYAEMLEIPVSTVNVVKKQRRRKHKNPTGELPNASRVAEALAQPPLKDSVIAQVNDKLSEDPLAQTTEITADAELFAEGANSQGSIDFDSVPDRIDTVRLYSHDTKRRFWQRKPAPTQDFDFESDYENEGGRYAFTDEIPPSKPVRIALGIEFAAACALCGAIFLTNVFMPSSAINTFFRSLTGNATATTDNRTYSDFSLSAVISDLSDAELTLSPTGILSFTDECCVYPAADGTVSELVQNADGTYRVKIAYSESFTGVIGGLDYVYYSVGETVKTNVPIGYSEGENEVQVTMYSDGELLNCFQLTDENCLAWIEQTEE